MPILPLGPMPRHPLYDLIHVSPHRQYTAISSSSLLWHIEAKLDLPKGWFDIFHKKILEQPFANVVAESDFQPTRLKPMLWEDTAQDKEEFMEIPLLDIDFSAGGGCYEIIDRGEFSLIFCRYYLHKVGIAVNAAPIIRSLNREKYQDERLNTCSAETSCCCWAACLSHRHPGDPLRIMLATELPNQPGVRSSAI